MDERQFGTLPSKTVFIKFVVPSILSMVFSSIYMIVDGIFVGNLIGSDALAAVNLVMPAVSIIMAISNMIAVGSSVKVSIALGEKNFDKANKIFSTSLFAIFLTALGFMIIMLFFTDNILNFIIKDKNLMNIAREYITVFIVFFPICMPLFAMDNFTRACGKAKYNMYINIGVSVFNIFLDWLFLVVLHGGMKEAALASCISMSIGVVFMFIPFIMKKNTLRFSKPNLSFKEFLGILYLGFSDFFNSTANSIIAIVVNALLLSYGGGNGVAAYAIMMYISGILFSVIYGMADSMTPAISYNVGAKNMAKTKEFYGICIKFAITVSLVLILVLQLFPEQIARLFVKDNNMEVIRIAIMAIRLMSIMYIFAAMCIVINAFLVAFDMARESIIIMALNSIVFPLSIVFIAAKQFGLNGIYATSSISSFLAFIVSIIIWKRVKKDKFI
ncbi:MATE family efflux transporter [Sedimentibacter sp. zth1]|uniref:MATE family efflux transporter n=1 Tax=Sedimentibacter sp. zth1 TaxID=2816908 RepID=UPI001A9342B7|nr:MATE family efflux transporter [Sedimentibacter sp. zth1]QSX06401.1 MATE family efflux transporter [Sedimentibacter sp. zth1]